jgi:predicted TPR repeat methyltransferase
MLLRQALVLFRDGKIDQARSLYKQILEEEPEQPQALHMLGLIHYQSGDPESAYPLLVQSLEQQPNDITVLGNLASILASLGRAQEAVEILNQVLDIAPEQAKYWRKLGDCLTELRRLDDAVRAYEQAIKLWPEEIDKGSMPLNHAVSLAGLGQHQEACELLQEIVGREPENTIALYNLGFCLRELGAYQEALDVYHRILELDPEDSLGVSLHLAATGAHVMPESAPKGLMQRVFDHYAGYYDCHMIQNLNYQGPQLILELLYPWLQKQNAWTGSNEGLEIMDLGCGTGLCAALLSPYAIKLDGIDLSGRMLKKASERGIYNSLIKADLFRGLQEVQVLYDCIVACDVLVYLGELQPLFSSVYQKLRPEGLFAFTVENQAEAGVKLSTSTRFQHSREYLKRSSLESGFEILEMKNAVLRHEDKQPVNGLAVLLRRP